MRRAPIGLFALLVACAAPGGRAPVDELHEKHEALEGAPCLVDAECDHGEYCDRVVCIPEVPCPEAGMCRAQTRWYDNATTEIPDADPSGVARAIVVDRPPATVARLHLSAFIEHPWRGDLRVVLRSPRGTEHVVHDRTGGSEDDLRIGEDLTAAFDGEPAEGEWALVVSDHARRDVGRIRTWRIELDYGLPTIDPPAPGADVWATVELPSTESAHPYANHTDETWPLTRFTGGAERARIVFDRIEVERGYDQVEVVDLGTGEVLDRFTGTLAGFTTREYPTGALGVRLLSDYSITAWGFRVAAVEVFGAGCLDDADCPAGTQCPNEVVRCITWPCFLTCRPEARAGEGEACGLTEECADGLYCSTNGNCRAFGDCGVESDCAHRDNAWAHVLCVGEASCEAGRCTWTCGEPLECADGETRDDGCNVCTCSEGRWACTERFCPPVGGPGAACGAGAVCDAGLVCDLGRTDGAACTSAHEGVCAPDETLRLCPAVMDPVCTCTGQTFSNDCQRMGMAPWAHDGPCALDLSIPDASRSGVSATVDVRAPASATVGDVEVRIDHTWRGDLVVWVEAPDGSTHVLTHREGRSEDDFAWRGAIDLGDASAVGTWTLHVEDHASYDTGVLRFFNVLGR